MENNNAVKQLISEDEFKLYSKWIYLSKQIKKELENNNKTPYKKEFFFLNKNWANKYDNMMMGVDIDIEEYSEKNVKN